MATFAPGVAKTATVTTKVTPAGVAMFMELWLGLNPSTKAAYSGKIAFTSTGANQTVACPVTMPSAAGIYSVYVDVYQGTTLVSSYVATETVTISGPTALVISNVVASAISDTGVTISWDLSDFGTGQVEYGTTPAYGQLSLKEYTFNYKHHDQVLSGLVAGTQYYFRVRSSNQAGIETVSDAYTFTTTGALTFVVPGMITWGNLDTDQPNWAGGSGLINEPSLNYLTDLIGPAVVPSSTSNPVVVGMYGDISRFAYVVQAGHAHGLTVSPYLYTLLADITTIINGGKLSILVNSVRDLLVAQNLDGICLDVEGGTNQAVMATLIDALYAVLNPLGKFISMNAQYGEFSGLVPDVSLVTAQKVAYIMPMCYEMWGYPDQVSGYPHASLIDSQAMMTKWTTAGYPKNKLIMFAPFFGRAPDTTEIQYRNIVAAINPPAATNEGVVNGKTYWWNGPTTIRAKARWIADNGYLGIGFFTVGYDVLNDPRSLLKNVYEELGGTPVALVISNVVASAISDTGVTISWDLNDFGTGQVEYGTTPAYGQLSVKETTFNFAHHDINIPGLAAGTAYYFRVRSSNQAGVETVSDAYTFTTTGGTPTMTAVEINAQLTAGKTFVLPSGVTRLTGGYIFPQSGSRMTGQDSTSTLDIGGFGILILSPGNVDLDNFRLAGVQNDISFAIAISATSGDIANVSLRDLYSDGKGGHTVHLYAAAGRRISGIECVRCTADSPDGIGFILNGEGVGPVIEDVTLYRCTGLRSGMAATRTNDWDCNFDLAEWAGLTVNRINVIKCVSDWAWESGFHWEYGPTKTSVVMIDNSSSHAGQKPGATFGAGILMPAAVGRDSYLLDGNSGGYNSLGDIRIWNETTQQYSNYSFPHNVMLAPAGHSYTRIQQGNCAGVAWNKGNGYGDVHLYSTDGLPVSQFIPEINRTVSFTDYLNLYDQVMTPASLVISNVVASAISDTGITISWDLSDFGTGQVEYGTTLAYGQLSVKEYTFDYKHHDQVLFGLTAGTKYYFRIRSSNQAGIETVSDAYTFTTTGGQAARTGVMVPLYIYPGAAWDQVAAAKAAHPSVPVAAILNSNSGPGTAYDATWNTYINRLVAAGVVCYGYVWCGETNEFDNNRDCTQDVARWKSWYPQVTAIFVDGFQGGYSSPGTAQVARARAAGYTTVMGNPGMAVAASLLTSVDEACVYETSGVPSLATMQSLANTYGASRNYFLPYGVATLDTNWVTSARAYCKWLYLTNDAGGNPWDTLPPYFSNLVAALDDTPVITNIITGYLGEYTFVNVPGCVNTIPYQLYTHMIFTHWMVTSASNPELITGWGTESYARMSQMVTNAHAVGCKALASLYHQPGSGLLEVIQSPTLRAQLVTNLKNLAVNYNLDGIDIDIEDQASYCPINSTTVPGLTDILIGDLYAALNPLGKIITLASAWDRRNILLSTDAKLAINQVMAYDMTYSPATGRAPVHANYADSVAAMNLWINAGFPRAKLVMGIPAYGEGGDGASVFWREIVPYINPTDTQNTANVTSVPTGRTNSYPSGYIPIVGGVLWWNGIKMIQDKVAFIKAQGLGGTMIFDAGHDLPVNGMQQVIYDALNS